MAELKTDEIHGDPPRLKDDFVPRKVEQSELKPVLIPDDIIRKGKEQQLSDKELDWKIAHPGLTAVAENWWKFALGGLGAGVILKLIGC